jgi:hypothetical protein
LKETAFSLVFALALAPFATAVPGAPLEAGDDHHEIIDRYLNATRTNKVSDIQMDAEIDASLPKLKKNGTLHALRRISKLGKITWDHLHFAGDGTIKKEVIARFIQSEQEPTDSGKGAITPENYRFKWKGLEDREGHRVYVFHLTPRKKAAELFKGEIWLDAETYLPVHEAGTFSKSPSPLFLSKVQFVRDYEILNGYAIPKHVQSQADTRFWGPAQVSIHYNHFAKVVDDEPVVATPEQQ